MELAFEIGMGALLLAIVICGIKAAPPRWPTDEEIMEERRKKLSKKI
jgi:hypothetical protein